MASDTEAGGAEGGKLLPVELRKLEFGRAVRGYDIAEVDAAMARVRGTFEAMWRERLDFELQAKELRAEVARLEEEQDIIRDVLVSAKRTATEIVETSRVDAQQMRDDADAVMAQAEAHARGIVAEAQVKADGLVRAAQEHADSLAREALQRAESESRAAREEAVVQQGEVDRLHNLAQEMKAGYRAFLVAALELLEGKPGRQGDVEARPDAADSNGAGPPEPERSANRPDETGTAERPVEAA